MFVGGLFRSCDGARLVSGFLPSKAVLWFTSSVGSVVGKFCSKDERVSISQLRYVFPDGLPEDFSKLARQAFRHVGEAAGELLLWNRFLPSREKVAAQLRKGLRPPEMMSITAEGDAIVEKLLESGTGAVGLSAHLGSFELLAAYLARRGLKCSVIGRSPNYPLFEKAIRKFRQSYGVNVIWSDAPDASRQIINAARSGHVICTLIDQDTKWKSDFSPFFGLEAACPSAPIQLALRYELPIFTSFIVRTAPLSHQISIEPILFDPANPQVRAEILKVYHERLEQLIRLYPEQYIWWHRRWRRRPGVDYTQSPQLLRNSSQYREWLDQRERTPLPAGCL